MKKLIFGIVQGRLSNSPKNKLQWFPQDNWESEFYKAKKLGIDFVELLTERKYNKKNPIWSYSGRKKIKKLAKKTNRKIYSICSDYIIDNSFFGDKNNKAYKQILKLLEASYDLGCKVMILPLLEKNEIKKKNFVFMQNIVKIFAKHAQKYKIKICIESILEAKLLKKFIKGVNENNVKCVFDTGNRVVYQNKLDKEIKILGNLISHVHIKDKNNKSQNVILGSGKVDFLKVFKSLSQIKYRGPLVFETTRSKDPVNTAFYNKIVCEISNNYAKNN